MELDLILRNFLNPEGKLTGFPAKRKMKIYALVYLSRKFEPGQEYTERQVNQVLNQWHVFGDPATLRRELYDYRFLDRSIDGRTYRLAPIQPELDSLGI